MKQIKESLKTFEIYFWSCLEITSTRGRKINEEVLVGKEKTTIRVIQIWQWKRMSSQRITLHCNQRYDWST